MALFDDDESGSCALPALTDVAQLISR